MKAIWSLAAKDLRLLFRDRMALFFIIVFPVLMGLFFGMIGASFGHEPDESSIRLGLVDLDHSEFSKLFVAHLDEIPAIRIIPTQHDAARDAVLDGKLAAYIQIPKGFGRTAGIFWMAPPTLELGVDPSRAAEGYMIRGYIMQAFGQLVQERFRNPASIRRQVRQYIDAINQDDSIPPPKRALLATFMRTLDAFLGTLQRFNDQMNAADHATTSAAGDTFEFVNIDAVDIARPKSPSEALTAKLRSQWDIPFPSAMLWGVMGCVAGFAISLVRERVEGTLVRLQVAPISRAHVLAGKATACFLATLGVIAFLTALGLILGIQLARPDLLVLAALSVAICFVGLMMLVSVLGKTEEAVAGAGWAIIVVMCMFGGGMIPLVFMPAFMVPISNFSPVKWGIYALEGAIWRDFTFQQMLLPCSILITIGVVSFAVGARVFARRSGA